MPWSPDKASTFTKKADTPKKQRMWSDVADSALRRGASEGSAIKQASGVVKRYGARGRTKRRP